MRRLGLLLTAALALPLAAAGAGAGDHAPSDPYEDSGYELKLGGIHFHTAFSDGEPGSRPSDAYRAGRDAGWDFTAVTEHSEWYDLPVEADSDCLTPHEGDRRLPTDCLIDPTEDPDGWRKWDAHGEMAEAETTPEHLALRGFEWSSPYQGHIVVMHSDHFSNAAYDAGATMHGFWAWFTRDVELRGGADGLAIFAHPGREAQSFEDFRYVPEAAERVVGVEVYNRRNSHMPGFIQALDAGWHTGAIGSPDRHNDWTRISYPRTTLLIPDGAPWEEATVRETLLDRRSYATFNHDLRLRFRAGSHEMGSRITGDPGESVTLTVEAYDPVDADSVEAIEIYTNGGTVVARLDLPAPSNAATLTHEVPIPATGESWYFARVIGPDALSGPSRGDAISSPIWLRPEGGWVAGDLHVHTTYSHDVWGGADNDPADWDLTNPDPSGWFSGVHTIGWTPAEQIRIAETRGLHYLALTDHNDIRSAHDPGWASDQLILVPGYEASLQGHLQVLGTEYCYTYDPGTGEVSLQPDPAELCDRGYRGDPAAVQTVAERVRSDGGVAQINHPARNMTEIRPPVDEPGRWNWRYGPEVVPDSIEVWNITWRWQPPAPSSNANDESLRLLDWWLDRGERVAATGGSDNHWRSTFAVQGVGQPTTWVYVTERTPQGVLDGIRAGRTFVAAEPPAHGGALAFLEADTTGDGIFDAMVGEDVPAGATARVRVENVPPGAWIRVVTSAGDLPLAPVVGPADTHTFTIPADASWVRAEVFGEDALEARQEHCEPELSGRTSYCRNRINMYALTSALYVVA